MFLPSIHRKQQLSPHADKLPQNMLTIDPQDESILIVKFDYPGAPIRQLRLPCLISEVQNPQLKPYKASFSKIAHAAMKEALDKYLPMLESASKCCIEKIKMVEDSALRKLELKEVDILRRIEINFELFQVQIQKEVREYKQGLSSKTVEFRRQMHAETIRLLKQATYKIGGVEEGLITCQQNQQEIYLKWEDIELDIQCQIDAVKDKIDIISRNLSQKASLQEVNSLLEKQKLVKPRKESQTISKMSADEPTISLDDFQANSQAIKLRGYEKQSNGVIKVTEKLENQKYKEITGFQYTKD